jgi:ectoine hydroxylase-related dioxygenase (phytanoyl-CoA dioxygenase family)
MSARDVYAVRRAFDVFPALRRVLSKPALLGIVRTCIGEAAFVTKSIWFEKPTGGNWFVGWHQDISISVTKRVDTPGYSRWTAKHGIVGVVPPLAVLERTLTIRIHLDDADADNGAVRVIPASHRSGIQPPPVLDTEGRLCVVPAGGIMLMRPLLMHASSRSRTSRPRRVLHIELNDMELADRLEWAERIALDQ